MMEWPDADWADFEPFPFAGARRAFTGKGAPERLLPVRYFRRPSDGRLVALTRFGERVEGAPGQAHGGAILAVFDEALGAAAWVAGHPVFTVRLSCEFRRSVPIPCELLATTEVYRTRRKLIWVRGGLYDQNEDCYARADAEFFLLDEETTRRLKGG